MQSVADAAKLQRTSFIYSTHNTTEGHGFNAGAEYYAHLTDGSGDYTLTKIDNELRVTITDPDATGASPTRLVAFFRTTQAIADTFNEGACDLVIKNSDDTAVHTASWPGGFVTVTGDPSVSIGGTSQLSVSVKNNESPTISWTSADTGKATVDSNGLVTGVSGGTVTITATETVCGAAGTLKCVVAAAPGFDTDVQLNVVGLGSNQYRMDVANNKASAISANSRVFLFYTDDSDTSGGFTLLTGGSYLAESTLRDAPALTSTSASSGINSGKNRCVQFKWSTVPANTTRSVTFSVNNSGVVPTMAVLLPDAPGWAMNPNPYITPHISVWVRT